jgi:hypothetical protein
LQRVKIEGEERKSEFDDLTLDVSLSVSSQGTRAFWLLPQTSLPVSSRLRPVSAFRQPVFELPLLFSIPSLRHVESKSKDKTSGLRLSRTLLENVLRFLQ